jgi:hypothetical protein
MTNQYVGNNVRLEKEIFESLKQDKWGWGIEWSRFSSQSSVLIDWKHCVLINQEADKTNSVDIYGNTSIYFHMSQAFHDILHYWLMNKIGIKFFSFLRFLFLHWLLMPCTIRTCLLCGQSKHGSQSMSMTIDCSE